MRPVSCIVAVAALAGTAAGCASPYYSPQYGYSSPQYGYSQATYYPSGYSYRYPATYYSSYPTSYYTNPSYGYSYSYPSRYYGYDSTWNYYRNYNGIHPGPERTP